MKFALAGRSLEKLQSVKKKLTAIDAKYESLELFSGADTLTAKRELIDDIVTQTSVILSTAGPFSKFVLTLKFSNKKVTKFLIKIMKRYGLPLVDSCVRNGTNYCDITGESTWVRTLIDTVPLFFFFFFFISVDHPFFHFIFRKNF